MVPDGYCTILKENYPLLIYLIEGIKLRPALDSDFCQISTIKKVRDNIKVSL